MPYASGADMLLRFGETELRQLSDIGTPRTGSINDELISRVLADASAWIDGYLVGRYPLPITDAGALVILSMHCCNEARFLLMTSSADEAAVKAHEERAAFFMAIAKGTVSLLAPSAVPAAQGVGQVLFNPGSKVWGRESGADGFGDAW